MDAAGWAAIITAAVAAVGGVFLQALHMYLSYKRDVAVKADVDENTRKIEDNTKLTVAGTQAATTNAATAAKAAVVASNKADAIAEQLNGKLTERIQCVVKEIIAPINADVAEIKQAITELKNGSGSGRPK